MRSCMYSTVRSCTVQRSGRPHAFSNILVAPQSLRKIPAHLPFTATPECYPPDHAEDLCIISALTPTSLAALARRKCQVKVPLLFQLAHTRLTIAGKNVV